MLRLRVRDLVRRHLGLDVRRIHVDRGTAEVGTNFDEQSVIEVHLRAHPPAQRFFVDIGAADGEVSSNTAFLARAGWGGIALEMDPDEFARLARVMVAHEDVTVARVRVTPANVVDLLRALGAPRDPGFVSIDIDGYDHDVLDALLEHVRPALVCTEINEKVPPPVRFHVRYDDDYGWRRDHFYGHSLSSVVDLGARHGYVLVAVEYNNAFLAPAAPGVVALEVDAAYRHGYLDRPDRLERLPWNRDVEHLHSLPPDEVVAELTRLFADRTGEFTISSGACDPRA